MAKFNLSFGRNIPPLYRKKGVDVGMHREEGWEGGKVVPGVSGEPKNSTAQPGKLGFKSAQESWPVTTAPVKRRH